MNIHDFPKGIYNQVTGDALEDWTSKGWRVVAMGHVRADYTENTELPHPALASEHVAEHGDHDFRNQTVSCRALVHHEEIRYLIRLDEESALAKLSGQVQELGKELSDTRAEAATRAETIQALTNEKAQLDRYGTDAMGECRRKDQQLIDGRKRERAMADDIGKVRESIGSQRWTEIVEAK